MTGLAELTIDATTKFRCLAARVEAVKLALSGLPFERFLSPGFAPKRILDLGCQEGAFACWAHTKWPRAWIDLVETDPELRALAAENAPPGAKLLDPGSVTGAYDLVRLGSHEWARAFTGFAGALAIADYAIGTAVLRSAPRPAARPLPPPAMLHVISTGLRAPTKEKCLASVRSQRFPVERFRHVYVEAGDQNPPRRALENFLSVALHLPPDDVILMLDGDDWFAHDRVLERVAAAYEDPAVWVTHGSFRFADGRPGFTAPYPTPHYRKEPWLATHLKTYRAGLLHRMVAADADELFAHGVTYRDVAWDQAIMLPLLECAGPEHVRHIPEVLYVYNFASSFEHNADAAGRARELAAVAEIRALPPRERLATL